MVVQQAPPDGLLILQAWRFLSLPVFYSPGSQFSEPPLILTLSLQCQLMMWMCILKPQLMTMNMPASRRRRSSWRSGTTTAWIGWAFGFGLLYCTVWLLPLCFCTNWWQADFPVSGFCEFPKLGHSMAVRLSLLWRSHMNVCLVDLLCPFLS